MDKDQFKALMADNEKILIFVDEAIQTNLNYFLTLAILLSLAFLFTALKLSEIIAWEWLWVLAPGWLLFPSTFLWHLIAWKFHAPGIRQFKHERAELIKTLTEGK